MAGMTFQSNRKILKRVDHICPYPRSMAVLHKKLMHLGIYYLPLLKSQVKFVSIGSDHRLVFLSYRPVLGLSYDLRSFIAFHPADNTPTLDFDAPQGWEICPREELNGRSSGLSCALLLQPSSPQTAFIFPRVLFFTFLISVPELIICSYSMRNSSLTPP